MARYIRYKRLKQQINFLNCNNLDNWEDTCNTRLNGFYDVCELGCNCGEYGEKEPIVQYRFKELNPNYIYICEDNNRYYKVIKESSYDEGKTWYKVIPEEVKKGDLYEANSKFCTSESIKMQWFDDGSEPYCDGISLMKKQIKRISFDNGSTWEDLVWNKPDGTVYKELRDYVYEKQSCQCGYSGLDYFFDNEYICGKDIEGSGYTSTSKYEIWREKDVCTLEPSGKVEYRNPQPDCDCGFTGNSFVFEDEYICGFDLGSDYDQTSKYEIWREKDLCTNIPTGKIEYRNPQPDCECGYREYKWIPDENDSYVGEYGITYVKYYLYELCPYDESYNKIIDERYSMHNTLITFIYEGNNLGNNLFNGFNSDYIEYVMFNGYRYEGSDIYNIQTERSGTLGIKITDTCKIIPMGVERIPYLKAAIVGNGVITIDENKFRFCSGLTESIMSDDVTIIDNSAYYDCSNLTKITFSKELVSIGDDAFYGCNINSIELPKTLKKIGRTAFKNNILLANITCLAEKAPELLLSSNTEETFSPFDNISPTGVLKYPKGSDYREWKKYLKGWDFIEI